MATRLLLALFFSSLLMDIGYAEEQYYKFPVSFENKRNDAVDYYLKEQAVELPKGDYLLVAIQPMGIVSRAVIYDLTKNQKTIFAGSHGNEESTVIDLKEPEQKQIISIISSEALSKTPTSSGYLGRDGYSIVVYYRMNGKERLLNHWQPDHPQILKLANLLEQNL